MWSVFFFLCSPLSWYFFLFYHMKLLAFSINKPWALTSAASIAQSVFSMLFSYYPCLCLLNYYLSFLIHLRRHLLESYPNLAIPTVCYTHLFIFLSLPLDSDLQGRDFFSFVSLTSITVLYIRLSTSAHSINKVKREDLEIPEMISSCCLAECRENDSEILEKMREKP